MKKKIFLAVLGTLFFLNGVHAQQYSMKLDSLTKNKLDSLSAIEKEIFVPIIEMRAEKELYKRIDSTDFDYLFMEETSNLEGSLLELKEYYFFRTDSVRGHLFRNGKQTGDFNPDEARFFDSRLEIIDPAYYWSLSDLVRFYSESLIPAKEAVNYLLFQPAYYASEEEISEFKTQLNLQFRSIVKIYTLIDKKNQKLGVSVQLPKTKPNIEVYNDILKSPYGW